MKFKVVIFSILLLQCYYPAGGYGQNNLIDSLQQEVSKTTDPKVKAELLLELHKKIRRLTNFDPQCLIPLEELLRFAEQENLPDKFADGLVQKANYYQDGPVRNLDSIHFYLNKAHRFAQERHYPSMKFILLKLGSYHFLLRENRAQIDSALYYFERSIEANEDTSATWLKASALQGISQCYSVKGDLQKALEYALKAVETEERFLGGWLDVAACLTQLGRHAEAISYHLEILNKAKASNNEYYQKLTLVDIGSSYNYLKEFEKALPYLLQSLELFRKAPHPTVVFCIDELGVTLSELGRYEEAISYYREAYSYCLKNNSKEKLSMPTNGLGKVFIRLNEPDSARKYLNLSLDYATKAEYDQFISSNLIALGKLDIAEGMLEPGIKRLTSARELLLKSDRKNQIIVADEALYQAYKQQGNYRQALQYHEEFRVYSDSVFNKETTARIARMESQHEFEQEKQQLENQKKQELLEKDGQLQRQRAIQAATVFALLAALLFGLISVRYYRLKQRANQMLTKLNTEIQGQKEQLQEMDRLKSRFFTNIAHELRTPLTIIGGMAKKIKESPKKWLDKGVNLIERNNANLLNLVNQIMDLRKLEAGSMSVDYVQGDVGFYIKFLVESFHSLADSKGIQLHFLSSQKELVLDYDQEKLLRILSNLLSNAIKFTPEGGHVYITAERLAFPTPGLQDKLVDPSTKVGAESLEIKVQDTGVGIPKEKKEHIFNRFYQVDDSNTRQGEGTGIGLALTYELVKLMKGDISVESELDKGSTFKVILPISRQAPLAKTIDLDQAAPDSNLYSKEDLIIKAHLAQAGDKPTLLIIEDNTDLVVYMESLLANQYQLLIATDGQMGVEKAMEHIPDMVLSDVMMPGKDGYEVCNTLKQDIRTSHIPIILLTAKADVDSRISGLEQGADAYLAKPFEERELLVRIEKLLELRKNLQTRYRSLTPEQAPENKEDEFVQKVRQAVQDNLADDSFGIAQLCRKIALSRAQLHNKLKALTGQSTSHFIRSMRLQEAKKLLEQSDLNVSEVGYEVGFKNPAHFSTAFQEEFGIPPSKTRK